MKLLIATGQNRPIHDGRVFPYVAIVELVAKMPVSNLDGRFEGSYLSTQLRCFTEISDGVGVIRVHHPEWRRSITIPNFQADMPIPFVQLPITESEGIFLRAAAGIIMASLPDMGPIEVVA